MHVGSCLVWRPSCTTPIAMTATIRKGCNTVPPGTSVTVKSVVSVLALFEQQQCNYEQSFDQVLPRYWGDQLGQLGSIGAMYAEIERQPDRERERIDHDRHQDGNTDERQHHRQNRDIG